LPPKVRAKEKQKKENLSSAPSFFTEPDFLKQGIIMAEVLGPPRAQKPWGR